MKILGNLARWTLLFVVFTVVFFLLLKQAPGAVAKSHGQPPWTLGSYINPRIYQYGQILSAETVHPARNKTWTIVRWKPAMTPMLYEEYLAFCGDQLGSFVNLTTEDSIVIIYSRAIEVTRLDGPSPSPIVACRSLDKVQKVLTPKEQN